MNFTLSVMRHPRYLYLVASGSADLAELCAMGFLARELGLLQGLRCVLFDVLALAPTLTDAERPALGRSLAVSLATFAKVAWVYHPDKHSGIAQRVATEHGVDLRVFDQLEPAAEWIDA